MRYLLIVLLLMSCGGPTDNDGGASSPGINTNDKDSSQTEENINISARLVMPNEEYPECNESSQGQLIYVKVDSSFYYCDENLGWVVIDLQGSDGRDGADGAPGKDGQDGRDGRDGSNGTDGIDGDDGQQGTPGVNGSDGEAAPYVGLYEWIHPVTGKKWFLGRRLGTLMISTNPDFVDVNNSSNYIFHPNYFCPTGSHVPTPDEMRDAVTANAMKVFDVVMAEDSTYYSHNFIIGVSDVFTVNGSYHIHEGIAISRTGGIGSTSKGGYPLCVVDD